MRRRVLALILLLALPRLAAGLSITGADWVLHFNLPDGDPNVYTPAEYAIRDALIARLEALQSGHVGRLATYTWSASNAISGGAGPILIAMEAALNRGAHLGMAVDGDVALTQRMGGSNSLAGLAARAVNPLTLVQDDSASGIMHHKLGLFDYGSNRWLMAGSWNFSQGASTFQWNTMLELRHDAAFAAYTNEFTELLAGRFHDHAAKSHAHDQTTFRLAGSWTNDWVRFAPYPNDTSGGTTQSVR